MRKPPGGGRIVQGKNRRIDGITRLLDTQLIAGLAADRQHTRQRWTAKDTILVHENGLQPV
jgi:hypothetical protein